MEHFDLIKLPGASRGAGAFNRLAAASGTKIACTAFFSSRLRRWSRPEPRRVSVEQFTASQLHGANKNDEGKLTFHSDHMSLNRNRSRRALCALGLALLNTKGDGQATR